jgi:SAM-dependent methyltransferase
MDKRRRRELEAEYARPDHWQYRTDPYEQRKYDQTLALVPPGRYRRVLEIGCSEGVFTRRLAALADEVLGLDVVALALDRARAECAGLRNVRFQQFDIERDQLDEQFDLIFCAEILYYVRWTRLRPTARKIARWVRRGGYLVAVHVTSEVAAGWGFGPKGAELTHRLLEQPGLRRVREQREDSYVLTLYQRVADAAPAGWLDVLDDLRHQDYGVLARAAVQRIMARIGSGRGQ